MIVVTSTRLIKLVFLSSSLSWSLWLFLSLFCCHPSQSLFLPFKASQPPVFLILPGFGNSYKDYTIDGPEGFRSDRQYTSLATNIRNRGHIVDTVPITRTQWLSTLRGLFTLDWHKRQCKPSILFEFYFREVRDKVESIQEKYPDSKIIFICHSAGGWLARGILADGFWDAKSSTSSLNDIITGIVTLGTPHIPPFNIDLDMTHGAWTFVNNLYPGCHLGNKIKYVTVAGTAVRANETMKTNSAAGFAYRSYKTVRGQLLGESDFIGDGVTPLSAAHLDGAIQITIPEAYHGTHAPNNMWFGGEEIIDKWFVPAMKVFNI